LIKPVLKHIRHSLRKEDQAQVHILNLAIPNLLEATANSSSTVKWVLPKDKATLAAMVLHITSILLVLVDITVHTSLKLSINNGLSNHNLVDTRRISAIKDSILRKQQICEVVVAAKFHRR
jgi:hypothetical protein